MQYPDIRSRAGLVALVFALIISLVTAVPIPATDSELSTRSNPSLNGRNYIQLDPAKKLTLPAAARTPTYKVGYFFSSYVINLILCLAYPHTANFD